jgi:hypothetical protein
VIPVVYNNRHDDKNTESGIDMTFMGTLSLKSLRQRIARINKKHRQIAYACFYLVGVIIFTTIIHEAGHIIAALALGVPFTEIKLGFYGINPLVTLPDRFASAPFTIQHYSCGFTAAIILLPIYLFWFRRYRKNPTFLNWVLGLITIAAFGLQLGQGYIEGRFHAIYILRANSLFDLKDIVVYMGIAFVCLVHFNLCPVSKFKKAGTNSA